MKKALLWTSLDDNRVQCELCHHSCLIAPGNIGACAVRENVDGILYSLNYGKTVALNVDPIEKKPLFHFFPGSRAFSVASVGCNFTCKFCQNSTISQSPREGTELPTRSLSPEELVSLAEQQNCPTIAHTYTEPTVYFEHAIESARLAKEKGIRSIFISNSFMAPGAIEMMIPVVDAINIDLKAFNEDTYRRVIGGRLVPVLENIKSLHEAGMLVEVTTLVVTDMNDSDEELRQIAQFIVSVSPNIPWHVSRFHPDYKMRDRPATPLSTIKRARDLGKEEGLRYVYSGNVPGDSGESTVCDKCSAMLVKRFAYRIVENRLDGNKCPDCGEEHHFITS